MLYDPKWKKQTAEPSLAGFIAWLEQQSPCTVYYWWDPAQCAIGRYCQSLGLADAEELTTEKYWELEGPRRDIAMSHPRTFGAALERARTALTSA